MRDYALGTTFDLKFTTRSFSTGAPTTMAGSPTVSAYPDNSTTEITAGITLTFTSGFDGVAGLCNVRVVATGGNGYAAGSNYALVLAGTGTVGGVSVTGEVIGEFSIEAQSPLRPTTAARTLDVSVGGEAGIDWANIGSPTTAVNLSATNIDVDQIVASVSGAVASVTGNVGGNVAGSVGSVTGNVGGNVVGSVASVTNITTGTRAEPGQGVPPSTTTMALKVDYLFKAWRNKVTQTSSEYNLFADDATTVDQKAATSDDTVTFTRGEMASGP